MNKSVGVDIRIPFGEKTRSLESFMSTGNCYHRVDSVVSQCDFRCLFGFFFKSFLKKVVTIK